MAAGSFVACFAVVGIDVWIRGRIPIVNGVAIRALSAVVPIRSFMAGRAVNGADMLEQNIVPFECVMAAGALPIVVTSGCGMAGSAIGIPGMVERDSGPGTRSVAVRAQAGIMAGWRRAAVTGIAVV